MQIAALIIVLLAPTAYVAATLYCRRWARLNPDTNTLRYQLKHGRYRVLYAEGHISQPFNWWTACKLRDRYGATIVPRNFVVGE